MNLLFTLLITASAAIASFLPSTGKVYDNSNRVKGLRRIQSRGWWTISFIFFTLGLIYFQDFFNKKELKDKEYQSKVEQQARDLNQKRVFEKNSRQTIVAIVKAQSEALGKYGYQFDSLKKSLKKIEKVSLRPSTINEERPVLVLCNDGIIIKKLSFDKRLVTIKFCSIDAGSTDFKLTSYIILSDSSFGFGFIGKPQFLTPNNRISKDGSSESTEMLTITTPKLHNFDQFIIYVKGEYRNLDKTKIFTIDDIYGYDTKNKKFLGTAINEKRENIINYLKSVRAIK